MAMIFMGRDDSICKPQKYMGSRSGHNTGEVEWYQHMKIMHAWEAMLKHHVSHSLQAHMHHGEFRIALSVNLLCIRLLLYTC
jgi:hypothetical protein